MRFILPTLLLAACFRSEPAPVQTLPTDIAAAVTPRQVKGCYDTWIGASNAAHTRGLSVWIENIAYAAFRTAPIDRTVSLPSRAVDVTVHDGVRLYEGICTPGGASSASQYLERYEPVRGNARIRVVTSSTGQWGDTADTGAEDIEGTAHLQLTNWAVRNVHGGPILPMPDLDIPNVRIGWWP